jgi:RNA polymerase sigma factor (sigma-70 family)
MATAPDALVQQLRRIVSGSSLAAAGDAALLDRFVRHRDEEAFAALVARHAPMVFGVCRRVLHDTHAAEDALQATFVVLARKASAIHRPEALASWLHRTAHRLALACCREEARRRKREERSGQTSPGRAPSDPLEELSVRELLVLIDEELHKLPEVYRLPVILCVLEGRTVEQAAGLLGWTPGSLQGRLERGRARLQQRLLRRGLTLSVALLVLHTVQRMARAHAPILSRAALDRVAISSATERIANGLSARVLALVQAEVGQLLLTRLKTVLTLVLLLGVAAGVGVLGQRRPVAPQPQAKGQGPLSPQHPAPVRTDTLGDPLPPGALARMGTLRLYHCAQLTRLVFSPDSKTLASAGLSGEVRLWEAATGKETRTLTGHKEPVSGVVFSPDGKRLLSACSFEPSIQVWETGTGKELHRFRADAGGVTAIALSRDGKLLASAGADFSIRLWDMTHWKELRHLTGHSARIVSLAFTPDGKALISGSEDRTIRTWDVDKGREVRVLTVPAPGLDDVKLSPDGKVLASRHYSDGSIRLWDAADGKLLRRLRAPQVWDVAFSPDGKGLATAGMDETLRLWDVATGKELHHAQGFTCSGKVAYAPNSKLLACSTSANAGEIRLRDPTTAAEVLHLPGHRDLLTFVAFSADGKTLRTSDCTGAIGFWETASGKPSCPLRPPPGGLRFSHVLAPTFLSPDGKLAAAIDGNAQIYLWRPTDAELVCKIGEPPASWKQLAFSPGGTLLAATHQDGTIRLWDTATGQQKGSLHEKDPANKPDFYHPIFSADGKALIAAARHDGTIRIWDVKTGREARRLKPLSRNLHTLALSPDGSLLACVCSIPTGRLEMFQTVCQLWSLKTGEELLQIRDQRLAFDSLAFSPDGKTLATAHFDAIRLWEVATGRERRRLEGHRGTAYSLSFSGDGRLLASAGSDHTALVWDVARRHEQRPGKLQEQDLQQLWRDLAGPDAERADRAIATLAELREQSIPFLARHLRPTKAVPADELVRLIRDLDSDDFGVRQKATAGLEKLGELAGPALRNALEQTSSLEACRRLERLLQKLRGPLSQGELLQSLRAVEVLEHGGTAQAQELLRRLAEGAPEARLTQEARAALGRLSTRPAGKP